MKKKISLVNVMDWWVALVISDGSRDNSSPFPTNCRMKQQMIPKDWPTRKWSKNKTTKAQSKGESQIFRGWIVILAIYLSCHLWRPKPLPICITLAETGLTVQDSGQFKTDQDRPIGHLVVTWTNLCYEHRSAVLITIYSGLKGLVGQEGWWVSGWWVSE